jgi:hypothetical protein
LPETALQLLARLQGASAPDTQMESLLWTVSVAILADNC